MKKITILVNILFFAINAFAQNVGIGTPTPTTILEVKKPIKSSVKISSTNYTDTSQLIFSNRDATNAGTDIILSSNQEFGLRFSSNSDIVSQRKDTILQITPQGNVGIRTATPNYPLDVKGNMNVTGEIKANGTSGTAGQILQSNGNNTMTWANAGAATNNGSVGFGGWGDCSTNNISEYNPVADVTGAAVDNFGYSVSISGNYAIVGAPFDDVGVNTNQGSASIYQLTGGNWVLMQKITDPAGALGDIFGNSVSISSNYAIVGAPLDDGVAGADQGSASIYQLTGGNWVLMQKITDPASALGDRFGSSVSISGNYAIVGAEVDDVGVNSDQGSASFYQLTGGSWVWMNKITDATGATNDYFGYSVSISGNYAIVGAYEDNVGANANQGSASIYQLTGGSWVWMNKITDPAGAVDDNFGYSVSISGNYAIVSAPSYAVLSNMNQGSASIYQLLGASWVWINRINDGGGAAGDNFGTSVSISGNYAIVGAQNTKGVGGVAQGSTSIYQRLGFGWQKVQFVNDPSGNFFDKFGNAVGIDAANKRFIIGAAGYGEASGKVVFGKVNF
jgi:FG-GAP repeat